MVLHLTNTNFITAYFIGFKVSNKYISTFNSQNLQAIKDIHVIMNKYSMFYHKK